jgi:hypothetical protein
MNTSAVLYVASSNVELCEFYSVWPGRSLSTFQWYSSPDDGDSTHL